MIAALINLPVVIPVHNQHPLINCKTPGRREICSPWKCNNCWSIYSYDVPSFYCTACDYDLCQKCFLSLNGFMIAIYNIFFYIFFYLFNIYYIKINSKHFLKNYI